MQNLKDYFDFLFKVYKQIGPKLLDCLNDFTQFETPFSLCRLFICSRCITLSDLYTFPLIIKSCASFSTLPVTNKMLSWFLIPKLNKSPLTKKRYLSPPFSYLQKLVKIYFCLFKF